MYKMIIISLSVMMLVCGCSYQRYEDNVRHTQYFMTDMTNEEVFDKCFIAYQFNSYRDRSGNVIVRLDGKFIIDETPHSVHVLYRFSDAEHYTIDDFMIDGQSEPEVIFLYYMSQLYEK